ncbi:biotin-dependent carboxyltransferase family protein [uncultured Shewanella sp.]|uniref:5-oxoprolinase subunit C family protein n=1 Tax=uncultured Shewanella sp. TaxID=173975 RepID=UPI002623A959|nr:biotin-dependent carboxyltransferase family protein [uncultured Shewanella sp.]
MPQLEVINSGPLSLIQDLGRFGVSQHGLSQGGPVDLHAYCWANHLLNNPMTCSQIEITLGQASFKAHDDLLCSLTGSDTQAKIDGNPIAPWQSFKLKKDQILTLGYPQNGLRSYLTIKHGFHTHNIAGSAATVIRDNIGMVALKQGDTLNSPSISIADQTVSKDIQHIMPPQFRPHYTDTVTLRVIESYQEKHFSTADKHTFYHSPYTVSPYCDRMGCRLTGPAIAPKSQHLISEPIAYGAIQIPPNGQPIILLNDRQTLGGYAKIGCIAKLDLPKLAQAKPDTKVHFAKANRHDALQKWLQFVDFFNLPF